MTGKAPDDPYADLVRRLLAHEIEPEAAAREAAELFEQARGASPTGFSLDFPGLSKAEADRLKRFAELVRKELLIRLYSGPGRRLTRASFAPSSARDERRGSVHCGCATVVPPPERRYTTLWRRDDA